MKAKQMNDDQAARQLLKILFGDMAQRKRTQH